MEFAYFHGTQEFLWLFLIVDQSNLSQGASPSEIDCKLFRQQLYAKSPNVMQ